MFFLYKWCLLYGAGFYNPVHNNNGIYTILKLIVITMQWCCRREVFLSVDGFGLCRIILKNCYFVNLLKFTVFILLAGLCFYFFTLLWVEIISKMIKTQHKSYATVTRKQSHSATYLCTLELQEIDIDGAILETYEVMLKREGSKLKLTPSQKRKQTTHGGEK